LTTGYSCPEVTFIGKHQFRKMYVKTPGKCPIEDTCHFKPEHGLTFKELKRRDKVLFTSLTNYFCNVQKAIEEISNIRNSRIAHVNSIDISKNEFESLWKLMEDSLLEIAASTQSVTEITLQIQQCATRDLDVNNTLSLLLSSLKVNPCFGLK
jgi:truncated hemoglobin YjbI